MAEFTNEFEIKEQISELAKFSLSYDKRFDFPSDIAYKVAAYVARILSQQMKVPIASWSEGLVAPAGVKIPGLVTVIVKLKGLPTDVEATVKNGGTIKKGDPRFHEAVKKFLDRKVDLIMIQNGYDQDGRRFYEKKVGKLSGEYGFSQGLQIESHVNETSYQTVIVDPVTQVKNKLNLMQALNKELEKRGIQHWTHASEVADEINKTFRTKAFNVRSVYTEQRRDDPQHNTYRFVNFDFSRGLGEDADPKSPVNFHRKYGRKFSLDQPIVKLVAHGGLEIDHIPELIEENPSLSVMKRYGVSSDIQAKSQMSANNRYYMTFDLLSPIVKSNLTDRKPAEVKVENFGPVRLTLQGDFIEIKSNIDFQKIHKKGKLLSPPQISCIHLFSTSDNAENARKLLKVLKEIFKYFGLAVPPVKENLNCPSEDREFADAIIETAGSESYGEKDLVLAVTKFSEDSEESAYVSIKARSVEKMFPVQFVTDRQITKTEEKGDLKTDLGSPLFLQIVAKCKGQPYGLQEGFAPSGTVFIGIDKHRHPFKKDAPLVTSIVLFDENGMYVCSAASVPIDSHQVEPISPLVRSCFQELKGARPGFKVKSIMTLVDTGIGTMWDQLIAEAKECESIAQEFGAKFAYVSADKGTRLRIYTGDPDDELSASKVSSFSAVVDMKNKMEILTVTTEPITMAGKEIGTPKSVLYTILMTNDQDLEGLKRTLAKCIVWLCRHAWISPASTRMPAPLFFANKVSRISAATGIPIAPDKSRAPLFL